jgi:hypothetical protein
LPTVTQQEQQQLQELPFLLVELPIIYKTEKEWCSILTRMNRNSKDRKECCWSQKRVENGTIFHPKFRLLLPEMGEEMDLSP